MALFWQTETKLRCAGCGLSIEETMDPANFGLYDATAHVCHACHARDEKAKAWNGSTSGLFWFVSK